MKNNIITRSFQVERGQTTMFYDFMTFANVFDVHDGHPKQSVLEYLRDVFMHGYPEREGKKSVSSLPNILGYRGKPTEDTYLLQNVAETSQYMGGGRDQHMIVQAYMMKNNPYILASEVPVWDEETHGFIDLLLYDQPNDKLIIADFKPNADKETKATSQLLRYRRLLAGRTGVKEQDILLYYFDHLSIYTV